MGFAEATTDLSAVSAFGTAHLFIDDCGEKDILCRHNDSHVIAGKIQNDEFGGLCYVQFIWACLPCNPDIPDRADATEYWTQQCNERFPTCEGKHCSALNV